MKKILVTLCLLSFVGITNYLSAQTASGKGVLVSGEQLKPGVLPKVRSSDDEVIMFNSNLSENEEGKIGIGNPKNIESMLHLWGGNFQTIEEAPSLSFTHVKQGTKAPDQTIYTWDIEQNGNVLNFTDVLVAPDGSSAINTGTVNFNMGINVKRSQLSANSNGCLKINTDHGYMQLGPDNDNWSHFHTDMEKFYFNKSIYVNGEIGSYNNNDLIFKAGHANDEAMRIKNGSGNVGIGTDNPEEKLDVNGGVLLRGHGNNAPHGTSYTSNEENIRMTGPTSDYVVSVQDGSGRIQHYWNSTTLSGSNKYLVTNEQAWMWDLSIVSDTYMEFKYATGGNAGEDIDWQTHMAFKQNGNVGIGTTNTFGYKLAVNGTIGCKEVNVETDSQWPDYVFEKGHELQGLEEIEQFVTQNKHLPGVPSANEVNENGIELGKMNAILLKKIEELTLHTINQQKAIRNLQEELQELKNNQ